MDEKKSEEKKREKNPFKETLLALLITCIMFVASEYFTLTPINFHSRTFLVTLAITIGVFVFLRLIFLHRFDKLQWLLCLLIVVALGVNAIGPYLSTEMLNAKKYARQIQLTKSNDFYKDNEKVTENAIPVVDKQSAIKLGDKKMGSMSEYVSQFVVDNTYNQINYNGKAVRVTTLNYGSNLKWLTNHWSGLPAYIMVDMVTQDTKIVKLENKMKFTIHDHFFRNINRYIRFRYPTLMYAKPAFEIDEKGNPFYVAPVYTYEIGLFGGRDIKGAIVVDASSGHVRYYRREKVPKWVDRVYPAELIYKQLENSGKYSGGFFNNYLTQKGVLKPTKGYSYLAIDDDIYMYTGFTSVSGDSSNVGFALVNMRTKKAKFYPIAGATEASAMKSAKGKVENYGYDATFPILLNVDNVPSYFLSLKDEEGLVKKYAFVSVENYEIVGIGDSVKEARENYMKLINDSGHAKIKTLTNKTEGKIASIKEVVVDGNTTYYFTLENDTKTYIASIKVNPQLPLSKAGDEVKLTYLDDSNEAKTVTKLIFITTKS